MRGRGGQTAIVLAAVYATFWIQFSVVRLTNFGGVDEWMILSLVSRGAVDIPYANRPLGLLFNLPVAAFPTHLLHASLMLHGHYLVAAGMLTSLLLLRLVPERPHWALLGGAFAASWAPSDLMRLNPIYSSAYSGVAAATVLVLLVLGTSQGRWVRVTLALGIAFVTTRVHEGPLPALLLAPVLLLALGVRLQRRSLAAYWGAMALAALVIGLPLLLARAPAWYQNQVLGLYLDPLGLAARLALQFRLHLEPLVTTAPAALLSPRPALAALVLVAALAMLRSPALALADRRRLAVAAGAGLVAAAAAYSSFILAAKLWDAARTEFIAAPFIGLALGATIILLAELVPARGRLPIVAALGAFVMACSAARTSQLQSSWDAVGAYGRQSGSLAQLLRAAPNFKPGTLVLFFEGPPTWISSFAFHHGLDLVYGPHVAGCVSNERARLFYECRQGAQGIRQEPWPVLKDAWRAEAKTYRFEEIVAFKADGTGQLRLLEEWPAELPALPADAAYSPRQQIVAASAPPATRHSFPGL
jgi:hypothetical protein